MLLPALSKAKLRAQGVYCMNNGKQLTLAAHMYSATPPTSFPGVIHSGTTVMNDPRKPWVPGWLNWTASADNTNLLS